MKNVNTGKLGVISDIHGNLSALETALDFLAAQDVSRIVCCGDVVGYGPWPNECVDLVRDRCECCVLGNHDAAAIGVTDVAHFSGNAGSALRWTQTQLTQTSIDFLKSCPQKTPHEGHLITHGSPRDPIWEYLTDRLTAYNNFYHFEERIAWFGHSHVPTIFDHHQGDIKGGAVGGSQTFTLAGDERYLINPGSVGQPRDGDWRLSLVIYAERENEESVAFHRLEYAVERTRRRMKEANLPEPLYNRLLLGR